MFVDTFQYLLLLLENETAVIRLDYGNPALGSCEETVEGGNHFRYWVQNGPSADRCVGLPMYPSTFTQ